MRALLSAHLLRRTKADPIVASQLQLPPVEWVTISLTLAEAERAAYDAATADLRASYDAFARAVDATSNARSAQSRLDESRRRRGVDAREYASAGTFSSLAQARKLGELNGALTRVRQMLCSPFAVNADKVKARKQGEAAVLASTTRLPHRTILERLVAQASRDLKPNPDPNPTLNPDPDPNPNSNPNLPRPAEIATMRRWRICARARRSTWAIWRSHRTCYSRRVRRRVRARR